MQTDDMRVKVRSFLEESRKSLEDNRKFEEGSTFAAILFADLIGSTEYKRDWGPRRGLCKTVLHNDVALAAIEQNGGKVVKYIGDAVMGMFFGENGQTNGLRAALRTIVDIDAANADLQWKFPHDMSTRIGVDFGRVWMFEHKESNVFDPQGPTVDLASRLTALAGPQQVVCSDAFYSRCSSVQCCASDIVKRYVKGVSELLHLRVVVPQNYPCDRDSLEGMPKPLPPNMCQGLDLMRSHQNAQALAKFQAVLEKDPGNFHANFYTASLLLLQAENSADLEKVQHYACNAKWARPHSSRVWLLISWLRYLEFEFNGSREALGQAIRNVETAVNCAEDGLNQEAAVEAKQCWAQYLLARSKIDEAHSAQDLQAARSLCVQIKKVIDDATIRHRADFHVTHASVLKASGQIKDAELAIDEAIAISPQLDRAYEIKGDLVRIQNGAYCPVAPTWYSKHPSANEKSDDRR